MEAWYVGRREPQTIVFRTESQSIRCHDKTSICQEKGYQVLLLDSQPLRQRLLSSRAQADLNYALHYLNVFIHNAFSLSP
jgi:hypothetical protein